MRRQVFTSIALALAVGISTCRAQPEKSKAHPGGHAVTQTIHANSHSIVLRSTHILLVEVLSAKAGIWEPSKPGLKSRRVDLSLHISETLRGKLDPAPIGPVNIAITQNDYDGELMMQPLPGVWSHVDLQPGTKLVVFSESDENGVASVLAEPACMRVMPAEQALPGIRIAVQAAEADMPLEHILALARPEAIRLDSTFADFLLEKYGAAAISSQSNFDLLADFIEQKGLDLHTRQALLQGTYDLVGLHGDATPQRAQRLALTMCRVLLLPEAADLHENLIGTYLPNLLGITSELPHQAASAVFKGNQAERNAVISFLHKRPNGADVAPLLTWLNTK
jgi:hypothetical protein